MKTRINVVGGALFTGGLLLGGVVAPVSATTWEYSTVPLMIHESAKSKSNLQADRRGLDVGESASASKDRWHENGYGYPTGYAYASSGVHSEHAYAAGFASIGLSVL